MARAHALCTALVLAAFGRALPYPFQTTWDDGRFIVNNPLVREPTLSHLWAILTRPHFQAYHPLHLISYWLDVPWSDASPPVVRATNLVLWVAAANLLLWAFRSLNLSPLAACLAALAVAVHPVQVEAVVWATGRKDGLAMLGAAATLLFHARAATPWDRNAWLSRAAFLCAALGKTTVLPLSLLLVLVDCALDRRTLKAAVTQQLPTIVAALILSPIVLTVWADNEMIRTTAGGVRMAPARAIATLGHQLQTALWPSLTAPMYDTRAINAPGASDYLLSIACVLGLMVRSSAVRIAGGGFILMMVPVMNLVPMYFPLQDRYLSLPLIPLALGIGVGLDRLSRALRAPLGSVALVVVVALSVRTVQYAGEWQSESRLWGHAASTHPQAFYAWMKLGEVRRAQGDLYGAVVAYAHLPRVDRKRKVGYAALLQAVALRDERVYGLSPSRAEAYARSFYAGLDDPRGLKVLASRMLATGHLRALELPLAFALSQEPVPDAALEQAARKHLQEGRPSVGLFYLGRMGRQTTDAEVRELAARARARVTPLPLFD
ncbi:MAG: hypothetical protein OXR73_02380 [Myxococcales bacterium]|nr:hypothetical protein [Myxococcales bacterium]